MEHFSESEMVILVRNQSSNIQMKKKTKTKKNPHTKKSNQQNKQTKKPREADKQTEGPQNAFPIILSHLDMVPSIVWPCLSKGG